ncbi:MAG: cobalt-precorrin-5B (C(1))-methyltransferase CbiD [Bacteroidaceae bacterium]|nr:cobalt-precorrin-5B (C(1))-methyltransferase CbiD [Bacteroidaceae bacterium]
MILVFGGTTEGRIAIKKLEEAGNPYYYSTRGDEQEVVLQHGHRLKGAMDADKLTTFCKEHGIQLLIDAAHPFAEVLHQTVAHVASTLSLPAIRFERIFPPRDPAIIWCNDYQDAIEQVQAKGIQHLLALTGVQTISKLKPLVEQGVDCYFRILNRENSFKIAHEQGIEDNHLLLYSENAHFSKLQEQFNRSSVQGQQKGIETLCDGMITKESGLTGGFQEKVNEAKERGMQIFAVCRPITPSVFHIVNGEHGLRRMVEKLLPEFYPLHSGITTGTCATAASVAALHQLTGQQPPTVPVVLPNGETIHIDVHYANQYAYVLKDSGDDPDVTKGIEIRASIDLLSPDTSLTAEDLADDDNLMPHILVRGGEGIGRITLPGFDYPIGSAAINKVPRQMIRQNIRLSLAHQHLAAQLTIKKDGFNFTGSPQQPPTLQVTIAIPEGVELAHRTFNPRLGIVGGISVVGVSGIIQPFSIEGFINSIRKCIGVAKAMECKHIVLHSGAKSQHLLELNHPNLPTQAFVEYGNYVGEALRLASEQQIPQVTIGIMLGKAVKLAEGHLDTHSRKATMNKKFIKEMMREAGCAAAHLQLIDNLNMARDLIKILPGQELDAFAQVVIQHCYRHCAPLLPNGKLDIEFVKE